MNATILEEIRNLRDGAEIAYVASVDGDAYPQVKAMLVLEHESLLTQYFSTNTSSARVEQFRRNPRASVYYCDQRGMRGALFTGRMEVRTDRAAKVFLWRDGFEMYYPKGVDDEDYCVLRFTAEKVNFYHGLRNETIPAEYLREYGA